MYIIYRILKRVWRSRAPPGKRIRHDALRGHLQVKYGKNEGVRIYKDITKELKERGYR